LIPLDGTFGAYRPFFSPDGKWVGFISANKLKKVSLESNSVFTICEVSYPYGANWLPNDEILLTDNQGAILKRVSSTGGIPTVITKVSENNTLNGWLSNPSVLPDGKHILCNVGNEGTIVVLEVITGAAKVITGIKGYSPKYIPTGHITCVYENTLVACSFDLKNKNTEGKVYPVINSIRTEVQRPSGQFSIANDGKIAFVPGSSAALSNFIWISRSGEELETLSLPTDNYRTFSLSNDGTKVAIPLPPNIWVHDMLNNTKVRITNLAIGTAHSWGPNQTLAFPLENNGKFSLFHKSVIGTGQISEFANTNGISRAVSWSKNGESIGFIDNDDLYLYSIKEGKKELLLQTPHNETQIDLSPDAKYFTYISDETGQLEVYVQSIPPSGQRWSISNGIGIDPIWSKKGDEILYRNTYQWYSVSVNTENGFEAGKPELLFEGSYVDVGGKSFALSPDGQRILLLKSDKNENVTDNLVIVDNWFEELKRITSDQ
jgi:serine/threonine-protein kinase